MGRPAPDEMSPEFAALQLDLVDRFVALELGTCSEGVHALTNFKRRLGLGAPTDPPSNDTWLGILGSLDCATTEIERVDIVMDAFASLPRPVPTHIAEGWPTVGAFSIQVSGTEARTHFYATEHDDTSPFHRSKLAQRQQELDTVLEQVRDEHPEIDRVAGGSWLYTTSSYTSLFPPAHVAGGRVRTGRSTFRGMSHWGQFLDYRWNLRPALADQFRARLAAWTGDDLCKLFPIPTLDVSSPTEVFD